MPETQPKLPPAKVDRATEMFYAKRSIELLMIAANDLKHYGSDPTVINNLFDVHDAMAAEYNEKYFLEQKPEEKKKG
jgi:hypothetical protein